MNVSSASSTAPLSPLPFSRIKRRRVFEEICERIRRKLARGEYKPGDKLPSERDLAAEFGVGRPAVREALRTLESSGVLLLKKGLKGGAYVREADPGVVTQSIHDLMNLGHISIKGLMEARVVLTSSVVALACERGTPEEFDAIERSIDASERLENYDDLDQRLRAGVEFFHQVALAAHNDALLLLVDSMSAIVRQVTLQVRPQTTALIPLRREILAAMRRRDAKAAQAGLRQFFDLVQEKFELADQRYRRLDRPA